MSLLDQSGVTGGGIDPYNVHALFVNMDNMWTERFGNYDCLVLISESLLCEIERCRSMPGFKSDHSFIELVLCNSDFVRGKGLWKFNAKHLDKPEFVFKINNVINDSQTKYVECEPDLKWKMIKCDLVGACTEFAYKEVKNEKVNINT